MGTPTTFRSAAVELTTSIHKAQDTHFIFGDHERHRNASLKSDQTHTGSKIIANHATLGSHTKTITERKQALNITISDRFVGVPGDPDVDFIQIDGGLRVKNDRPLFQAGFVRA